MMMSPQISSLGPCISSQLVPGRETKEHNPVTEVNISVTEVNIPVTEVDISVTEVNISVTEVNISPKNE